MEEILDQVYSLDLEDFSKPSDRKLRKDLRQNYSLIQESENSQELLNDLLFTRLPERKDSEYTFEVNIKEPTLSFQTRIQESKLLVIGASYSEREQKKWAVFDKNYIGIGREDESQNIDNPLSDLNWEDKGYWESVETLLRGKKYMNIIFDYGVTHHLHASSESMSSLVHFLSNVIDPKGNLFCMPVYLRLYFSLYNFIKGKSDNIHPQILFLRELYKKFSRQDQGYLHIGDSDILYDRWVLD